MKALIQRVSRGAVSVNGSVVGAIEKGYVVLLGVVNGDSEHDAHELAARTLSLRIFPDAEGKMNLPLDAVNGSILVVSQFTLCADTRKGNRPSFINAAPPELADTLYTIYVEQLRRALGNDRVVTGVFRAHMDVEIINDGPVTIMLESRPALAKKE